MRAALGIEDHLTGRDGDIQILRAIAAMLVLLAHSGLMFFPNHHQGILPILLGDLGNIGVAIFFAISGYIMVHTNLANFGEPANSFRFMVRRLLRVAPIYSLATLIAFISLSQVACKVIPLSLLALSLFFVPFYSNIEGPGFFPVLGVGWTLNLEMFFYVLFATALVFRRKLGLTLVTILVLGLTLIGLVLRPGESAALRTSALTFYSNDIMALFAAGMLVRWHQDKIRTFLARVNFSRFAALAFLACLLAPVAAALLLEPLKLPATQRFLQGVSALPLIVVVTSGTGVRSMLRDVLLFLGDASYSLYIFHSLILFHLAALWRALALNASVMLFIVNCAVSLLGSAACYLIIERPVRKRVEDPLRRWVDHRIRQGPPIPGGKTLP